MALSERRLLSAAVRASVSPVTKSAYAGIALNDANGVSACTSADLELARADAAKEAPQ